MGRPIPNVRFALMAVLGILAAVGCETIRTAGPVVPVNDGERSLAASAVPRKPGSLQPPLRVSQFLFYADVPLEPNDVIFRELEELPEQLARELQLPLGTTIVQVFLFEDQDRYEAYMRDRFPWLPARRAYFIADPKRPGAIGDLQVYTWFGEHLRTDLRHELTHALLHGALKGVPLWLDEGLAGFFELPPNQEGINSDHLDKLRKGPFQPDLARLEKIEKVKEMEKPEYREAWAWTHFLLRGQPATRQVLLDYLQQLRENGSPGPLMPKLRELQPDPNRDLSEHLRVIKTL